MSIKANSVEFLVKGLGHAEDVAPFVGKFIEHNGDSFFDAMRRKGYDSALEDALKNSDGMTDAAKAFLRRQETRELFELMQEKKAFFTELNKRWERAFKEGRKFQDRELTTLLKEHGIDETSISKPGMRTIGQQARRIQKEINETAAAEFDAQTDARGKYFGNSNWYVSADAAARHADNAGTRTMFRASAGAIRVARAGVPIGIISLVAGVGAHAATDGKSTELAVDALDSTLMTTVKAVRVVSPGLADLLEKSGKEGMIFLLKFSDQKADASEKAVRRFAERHNYAITDREAKAAGHVLGGGFIQAAFVAVTGKDIDLGEAAKILEEAEAAPDPTAYIKQEFKTRFGITDEQADEVIKRAEKLKPEVKAAVDQIKTGDAKAAVDGVKNKFGDAVDFDPVEKYGVVGGAMYSLALMSLSAGPKTAATVAEISQFLIGSWLDPILGLFNIKPEFNLVSGADAMKAKLNRTPSEMRNNPDFVAQEGRSHGVPTDLNLNPEPA